MSSDSRTIVDLRSDTVTQPTPAMRAAMADAEVGDDLAGEDPTVNRLQTLSAALLGYEAALYVATGTMANQLAIRAHTRPGTDVICAPRSHAYRYEDAGAARNAGVQMRPIVWSDLGFELLGNQHHLPDVSMIAIENTVMAESGRPLDRTHIDPITAAASRFGVPVHCDGARIWNAAIALDTSPRELVDGCDSMMFCLSKGLGAPIGSVLCGTREFVERARADKHRMGGGWRQAGIVAAAGIVALETMVDRLGDDHERANLFAVALAQRWPDAVEPHDVLTNVVCARSAAMPRDVIAQLGDHGILAATIDAQTTRFIFHFDVDDDGLERAIAALGRIG